jgi:chaperonin GroEL
VPGGGVALLNASLALDSVHAEGDAAIGVDLLRRALEEPTRQIALNGGVDGSVVVNTIRTMQGESGNPHVGYNVVTETYEDLVAAGVIDPLKVTRSALENASSIAQMILTTETLVADSPKKDEE